MSSSVDSIESSGASSDWSSSTIAAASRSPASSIRSRIAGGVLRLDLGEHVHVEPLGLAGLRAQLLLGLAELLDLLVGDLERLQEQVLGDLVGACLDHRQAVGRADDDQVEVRLVLGLGERRIDDELAVDLARRAPRRPVRRRAAARPSAPPRRR
jgi:hypothetical protein